MFMGGTPKDVEIVRGICKKYLNETIKQIGCMGYELNDYSYMVVNFLGGDNSGTNEKGKWIKYLNAIKELVENLETEFDIVSIIDMDIDCSDDEFCVTVSLRNKDDKGEDIYVNR